ncbi:ABC transporter ATP-binding protein [Bacillus sp. V5-8f]|uniref:ABC transporter ATP-binding protein n=1 Tax=Bacillus sp. V5-8f TaxID=2053044 RepID=UPI000C762D64|nr:ABC transporter ATP-binding protein [Bacillus sp. V5-8f]PLT33737.1 ABC transporter ATP-binding protein [Bacillus sp. V5-8f]
MADIRVEGVSKSFHKETALNDVSLEVKDKEFFIVFGPAGAGKTTLLNVIAGIHLPDKGHVYMNGSCIDHTEPEDRNVAMVFEDYALYPHLSVFDNMASPLRSPRYRQPDSKVKEEVTRVAKILKIDWLLERNPSELSNGQRQRVGLGRALVRTPNIFLMDEPITHLDAKLRHQMRAELKDMQRNLDTTTIYVTHDYLEALSLGDRIAVINKGKIEQIGTPEEIYHEPANEFVATVFGEPEINIVQASIQRKPGQMALTIFSEAHHFTPSKSVQHVLQNEGLDTVRIGIRPKDINYNLVKNSDENVQGCVYSFEPLGAKAILTVQINTDFIRLTVPSEIDIKLNQDIYIEINLERAIYFDTNKQNILSKSSERGNLAWQS